MAFEFWDKVMIIAFASAICIIVYLMIELAKYKENKSELTKCKKNKNESPEFMLSYLSFQKYRGDPLLVLKESDITKKITKKDKVLIRYSVIDKMKHTREFIVYNNMTLRYIGDERFTHLDIKRALTENEYAKLVNWCNILDPNALNCCPDGEAGRWEMISIKGEKPFNCCGSTLRNDAEKITGEIMDFFNNLEFN